LKRVILLLAIIAASSKATSDELYEFDRIRCDREFSEIEIEKVSFYNIGDSVWHGGPGENHVLALKRLEKEHGLYVFNEPYGYYSAPPVSISCGNSRVEIHYEKGYWQDRDNPEDKREYRSRPTADFYFSGKLFSKNVYLGTVGIRRLRLYEAGAGGGGVIEACAEYECMWLSPLGSPLELHNYEKVLNTSGAAANKSVRDFPSTPLD